MTTEVKTQEEIRQLGLEALARELGPVGMVRFLQQFETGHGDYTKDRHKWLNSPGVRELAERIIAESGEGESD
jgi:hypothetical protein